MLILPLWIHTNRYTIPKECCGPVIECLTQNRGVADSSLTGRYCVVSLIKTHLSLLNNGSTQEDPSRHSWNIVDWDIKNQVKQTSKSYHSTSYLMLSRKIIYVCSNIYEIVEDWHNTQPPSPKFKVATSTRMSVHRSDMLRVLSVPQ